MNVVLNGVTVNNNNPIQDYVHPDDQTQSTFVLIVLFAEISYGSEKSPQGQKIVVSFPAVPGTHKVLCL